jgi:hypothetical protein
MHQREGEEEKNIKQTTSHSSPPMNQQNPNNMTVLQPHRSFRLQPELLWYLCQVFIRWPLFQRNNIQFPQLQQTTWKVLRWTYCFTVDSHPKQRWDYDLLGNLLSTFNNQTKIIMTQDDLLTHVKTGQV